MFWKQNAFGPHATIYRPVAHRTQYASLEPPFRTYRLALRCYERPALETRPARPNGALAIGDETEVARERIKHSWRSALTIRPVQVGCRQRQRAPLRFASGARVDREIGLRREG